MIEPILQKKTVYTVQFDIQTSTELQELSRNYKDILEQACKQQGVEKDSNYSKHSKYIQPSYGVNPKGEPATFINVMSIDYTLDTWNTHNTVTIPAKVTVDLEDWSDIHLESLSEDLILEPKIIKDNRIVPGQVIFYIENLEQGKELVENFDAYMSTATKHNPYITGAETLDYNNNTIKDVTITFNREGLEKIGINRNGDITERSKIPLPSYISIHFHNWTDISYWQDDRED